MQAVDRANVYLRPPADVVGNYGRMPPLTDEGQKRRAAVTEARKGVGPHQPTPNGWVEELGPDGLQVRCILRFNSGPPITPGGYNQNVQIFQSRGNVVILNEMIHNARIVPMDGHPHLPSNVRQWVGDRRGHWEGETLVVDTTTFLRQTAFVRGGTTIRIVRNANRSPALRGSSNAPPNCSTANTFTSSSRSPSRSPPSRCTTKPSCTASLTRCRQLLGATPTIPPSATTAGPTVAPPPLDARTTRRGASDECRVSASPLAPRRAHSPCDQLASNHSSSPALA